jgi:hypothetical protein
MYIGGAYFVPNGNYLFREHVDYWSLFCHVLIATLVLIVGASSIASDESNSVCLLSC